MTRKHFRLLAEALRVRRPYVFADVRYWEQWRTDVRAVMVACREANPRFNEKVFLSAVGWEVSQ